jgi:hypothetical protein
MKGTESPVKPKTEFRDFAAPDGKATFDEAWKRVPIFHISRKQFRDWRVVSPVVFVNDWSSIRPPFNDFCIEIDDHASVSNWDRALDLNDQELENSCIGFVVSYQPDARQWTILERSILRIDGTKLREHTEVHSLTVTDEGAEGGVLFRKDLDENITEKIKLSTFDYTERVTLRLVMSLCYLLGEHVWEEYDPLASLSRPARRAQQREDEKRGHDGTNYRIFLNRKKKRPNPDGIGTGQPKQFQEDVRGHWRVYKSGRKRWIQPFTKGLSKPRRGTVPQYDAWGLDERA